MLLLQVAFFLPQLVQLLRSDENGLLRQFLMAAAGRSILFAQVLICTLRVGSSLHDQSHAALAVFLVCMM